MRTFIAFPVPKTVAEYAGQLQIELGMKNRKTFIRWVEPRKMHITLEFLGDLDEAQTEMARGIVREKSEGRGPFIFTLEKADGLPNADYPDSLVLRATASREAVEVQKEISQALEKAGIAVPNRGWHPHLTLGRMKDRMQVIGLRELPVDKISWQTDEVLLMASIMTKHGYEYHRL